MGLSHKLVPGCSFSRGASAILWVAAAVPLYEAALAESGSQTPMADVTIEFSRSVYQTLKVCLQPPRLTPTLLFAPCSTICSFLLNMQPVANPDGSKHSNARAMPCGRPILGLGSVLRTTQALTTMPNVTALHALASSLIPGLNASQRIAASLACYLVSHTHGSGFDLSHKHVPGCSCSRVASAIYG